jgi:hypothetical protein
MLKTTRFSLAWLRPPRWMLLGGTLWLCSTTWAAESDLFNAGFLFDSTSDQYDRVETFFDYRNHRREYVWPWVNSENTTLDWGVRARHLQGSVRTQDFTGDQIMAMLGTGLSSAMRVEGWLGSHVLKVSNTKSHNLTNYSVNIYVKPTDTLDLHLENARDYVYQEDVLPAGIVDELTAHTTRLGYVWRPVSTLRIVGNSRWRSFDDGNRLQHNTLNVLYGISPDSRWIWFGIGGENLNYSETKTGYWSPSSFSSYGLRSEGDFPVSEWLDVTAQANLDRIKEVNTQGTGNYLALGLKFRVTDTLYIKADAARVRSVQSGSAWTENTYILSLAGALF